jgi:hypothetical protein
MNPAACSRCPRGPSGTHARKSPCVALDVLGELKAISSTRDQLGEHGLSLLEPARPQIFAVELEQVESVHKNLIVMARLWSLSKSATPSGPYHTASPSIRADVAFRGAHGVDDARITIAPLVTAAISCTHSGPEPGRSDAVGRQG